ncbi:polyphosphate kinase 2 family protein [Actinoplanes awajinensis]|uniref:UDP-galactose-lipid carrier transferase n=1 Tax=Actinoplanes awajinensis subsp. mycoplanecinus TaxID=135947 RepID=A0A0X3V6U9_9ACTN|nr:UDP-galactose-lipid carrier transferase [Actinoplanes awajinensis]KUL40460.1 UDP-galactose-lipid carrier transferase [Actinoplanes awajinensis subsp. mycoplanecinus]
MGHLGSAKPPIEIGKKKAEERLKEAQERLLHLRLVLGGQIGEQKIGPPLCVVFEGWDASGKGGAIKRLVAPLDPRHVRVAQFAAPTYDEKRHHFLQRFWNVLPGKGGMAVLDRSWYGRVLVERVEGFATGEQWKRAYDEITEFERTLAAEGMILIKFWMHVSPGEQLRRFKDRAGDPLRTWKLTDEDWRNREKRDDYEKAIEEMLTRTDQPRARWHVIPGDDKGYARLAVVEQVCQVVEKRLAKLGVLS